MSARTTLLVCVFCAAAISCSTVVEAGDGNHAAADAILSSDNRSKGKVRLLLLAPTGPLVIEAEIAIGGRPFRVVREQFIDEVLESADTNGDGKRTWQEAIENPRLAFGRLAWRLRNAKFRHHVMNSCDRNRNGIIERNEARLLMSAEGDGPVFRLRELLRKGNDIGIEHLLDVNDDHVLSKSELAVTRDRLKSRDTNNNDWLETRELLFARYNILGRVRIARDRSPQFMPTKSPRLLHQLGPTADVAAIQTHMERVYGEQHDVSHFQTGLPQITVRVSLGERDLTGRGIEVTSTKLGLRSRTDADPTSSQIIDLELSGTKLRFAIGVVNRRPPDFDEMAKREMALRDEDENGVLEAGELDAPANTALAQAYSRWDSNRDGRVTLAEIKADYEREHLVRWSQVEVTNGT